MKNGCRVSRVFTFSAKPSLVFFAASLTGQLWADVRLPAVFSDNMVLQQGVSVPVRGWASPAETVTLEFAGQRKETTADRAGAWQVKLDPVRSSAAASDMKIYGKNAVVITNVVVGDVWLASGQSNMEMPLRQAEHATQEIEAAHYPDIRFFMTENDLSSAPKDDCAGKWIVCTPARAGDFPAAAYFFAQELHSKYRVPAGIINSSIGASSCQAWTPAETLVADKSLPQPAALAPENYASWKAYLAFKNGTYDHFSYADTGVKPECLAWSKPGLDVSDWRDCTVPGSIESQGLEIDGAVWFRKEFEIPAAWAGSRPTLSLGPISDNDIVYLNGEKVGATENNWREWIFRYYAIPAEQVKAGKSVIAVRIFNRINSGGFYPTYPAPLKLYLDERNAIILSGAWKCKVERAEKPAQMPFVLPSIYSIPASLFNALIAPFAKYPLRGFIWYQGEGNTGAAEQYDILFPAMIKAWRSWWADDTLPFYFVQLANFMDREAQPSGGGLPRLREAQLKALSLHGTGMAVAIDIGAAQEIHPRNKREVGKRLARWAMRDCYGDKEVEVSGPLYASSAVEGSRIRLAFTHVRSGLKAMGGELKGFAVAPADKNFVWAQAVIEGESVVVWNDAVREPRYVRYAWANNPEATLYNGAGLPASPFRTDK